MYGYYFVDLIMHYTLYLLHSYQQLHDDQLRKKYSEEAPNNRKLQFENEFIRFADKMIQDIEAKIKRGKMRIALANGPDGV